MNTGHANAAGRRIMRGPRGGLYVITETGTRRRVAALPAAAPAPIAAPTNIHGRVIHTSPRGAKYIIVNGRKVYKFKVAGPAALPPAAPAASPPLPAHIRKAMKINNLYMTRYGNVFTRSGNNAGLSKNQGINMAIRAYAQDPKFLVRRALPFKNTAPAGSKLKPTNVHMVPSHSTKQFRLFYNRRGLLHYMRLNNKPVFARHKNAGYWGMQLPLNVYENTARRVGRETPGFPRSAIPLPLPVANGGRNTASLLNAMYNRIYGVGRAGRINVSNMTANEKARVTNAIKGQINASVQIRNAKKRNVNAARARGNHGAAAAAMERVGYFNNSVRALTRGYRALKPLTGAITGSPIWAATPNRYSPAPAGTENVIMTGNLETPHIVVKVPGSSTLYMNPNSLKGMIKNGSGANLNNTNLRAWLRMARRNFPNEPLFRHYINRNKNVTAKHIRFSRYVLS